LIIYFQFVKYSLLIIFSLRAWDRKIPRMQLEITKVIFLDYLNKEYL